MLYWNIPKQTQPRKHCITSKTVKLPIILKQQITPMISFIDCFNTTSRLTFFYIWGSIMWCMEFRTSSLQHVCHLSPISPPLRFPNYFQTHNHIGFNCLWKDNPIYNLLVNPIYALLVNTTMHLNHRTPLVR